MPSYTEEDIKNAIQAVLDGDSVRKAAAAYKIPESTLHHRLRRTKKISSAETSERRLSEDQEFNLTNWIIARAALGFPPTHQQLEDFTTSIVALGGDERPLGKHWVEGFLQRNPEVITDEGRVLDSKRINGAATEIAKGVSDLLAHL
ncbi:uncharacterized protein CPUR_05362 [Claviceps purpurea 20.1]|uniref:HTH CENPB-type domain-containing protein n=1 Tax=Claviceps purpurea (strain 20.1) TaxID=1111077 RepID=M1WG67_CLAP2|nr:uncharacterized protein CPUR_05362 [Claviceps purpurea 20.1]